MNRHVRHVICVVALSLTVANCAGTQRQPPQPVTAAALDTMLLSADEISAVMGTTVTPHPRSSEMNDHREMLQNRNCLSIWQTDEAVIYDNSGWTAVRRQLLRAPDIDQWTDRVVQSVVSFPSAAAARAFLAASSDRWSKCTNHRLNITVNDQRQPSWMSGELTKTDTSLTIPVTRGSGDQAESCQRTLAVDNNVVIDVEACSAHGTGQAGAIVRTIESKVSG